MGIAGQPSNHPTTLIQAHSGQQLHVSGVFIVLLEIALIVENLLPTLVVVVWLPAHAREVNDRLVAAFSITCILSALVPTPLGLASYFSGGWYGGVATCTTYQVTSMWCNLTSLAILTYICVNSFLAVCHLMRVKPSAQYQPCRRTVFTSACFPDHSDCLYTSKILPSPQKLLVSKSSSANQNVQSLSTEQHDSPSNFVNCSSPIKATDCPKNATESVVSVDKNKVNLNSEVDGSKIECDNTLKRDLPRQTFVVAGCEDTHTVFQSFTNLASSRLHVVPPAGTFPDNQSPLTCTNSFKHCVNEDFESSGLSPAKKASSNISLKVTDSCTGGLLHLQLCEQSSATDGSTASKHEFAHSPVTTLVVISEKLEVDVNNAHCSDTTNIIPEIIVPKNSGCLCMPTCQSKDIVMVLLIIMFACTLAISSLPILGFGPQTTHSETSCRSWLVPIPLSTMERTFYVVYLLFVYICLVLGCSSGVIVCLTVSKRMKRERKRRSRLYHEEENIPDVSELCALDDLKRHYSLTCVVMAGLLTWLPIVTMLTLQKLGVQVSEATLMYSNIATSLPGLLNPLLYSLALAKYRNGYKIIMEKCCCKGRAKMSQCPTEIQANPNTRDGVMNTDTTLNATSEGHTCLQGRANPSFDSHAEISVDESDEENDEDYLPDDSELMEDDKMQQAATPSEKTPLQCLTSSSSTGVLRTVFTNRSKSPWQRQQESNDSECLLDSRAVFADEETGL